jgi:hypothetical protein
MHTRVQINIERKHVIRRVRCCIYIDIQLMRLFRADLTNMSHAHQSRSTPAVFDAVRDSTTSARIAPQNFSPPPLHHTHFSCRYPCLAHGKSTNEKCQCGRKAAPNQRHARVNTADHTCVLEHTAVRVCSEPALCTGSRLPPFSAIYNPSQLSKGSKKNSQISTPKSFTVYLNYDSISLESYGFRCKKI